MRLGYLILVLAMGVSTSAIAQQGATTGGEQAATTADQPSGKTQTPASNQSDKATQDDEKPGAFTRLKRHLRDQVSSGCVNAIGNYCWDKPADRSSDKTQGQTTTSAPAAGNNPAQSGQSGESSSKSTKIDLSPPPGEAAPPGVGVGPTSDIHELKPWNPHKADKDVEVGDFYLKRGNYRAAESRYKEALYWQDNHAIAHFRLGQTEEKLGNFTQARKYYSAYLDVLPDGEFANEARKGLERLKGKSDQPVNTAAK